MFVNVNPQATLLLGQARGACVTALVSCDLAVAEYTALQMKQAVAGHGKAAKAQVQEMVKRLLQLPGLPGKDAADALGLAITHAHAGAAMARLGAGGRYGAQAPAGCTRAAGRTEASLHAGSIRIRGARIGDPVSLPSAPGTAPGRSRTPRSAST